jgi:ABC-type nitrate/sulfonate/bicarbonate transport system permease component
MKLIRKVNWLLAAFPFLLLLAAWEIISRLNIYNRNLFPPPTMILPIFFEMLVSGEWISDVSISLFRYGAGFIIGTMLGIIVGIITGKMSFFRKCLSPVLNFMRSTPSIVLIPLAILWFGIGEVEKITVVVWGATFPVWLNTQAGISEIDKEYIWAAKSLGAKKWRMFYEVYLPSILPFIIAGVRMAIATSFFALAAVEMSGAFGGIAFRIFNSHQMFRTDKMMVAILTMGTIGITFDRFFVWSMKRILPWWRENA